MILVNDQLVRISRKRHRALLYYLAAQAQPVSREEICGLFWPDDSEDKARKNLREALSRIRSDLDQHQAVYTVDDQITLDSSLVYSDKREFDRILLPLLNNNSMNSNSSLPDWMVLQLLKAMELCRNPQFLQGILVKDSPNYEKWVEFIDHEYGYQRLKIIDRLADHYISKGDLDNALIWLGIGLETDRMNAEMNYLFMTCLRDLGKFRQVVDYSNYLEGYYRENDEAFPAEFIEIRKKAEISRKSPEFFVSQTWPDLEDNEIRFFGRKAELEHLGLILRKKGVVVLQGESGVGKTRLVKEFFSQLPYSPRLFYCQAHPLNNNVPFQTIIDGLQGDVINEWKLIPQADQEILLNFYHKTLQDGVHPQLPKTEMEWLPVMQDVFKSFSTFLEQAALRKPVLFVIDDAQWLDRASISLINYLVNQNFFNRHGLLLISKRKESENAALKTTLNRWMRQRKMEEIELNCFTKEEASNFLQTVMGKNTEIDLINKLIYRSGGNPFYLVECMRSVNIRSTGGEAGVNRENLPVPDLIKRLVDEKLDLLNPASRSVLQTAAVMGHSFTPEELEKACGLGPETTLNALEEITQNGFVAEDFHFSPAGGYTFLRDIEREYIETGLTPARRQFLHRDAAEGILACKGNQPEFSHIIADHYEKAAEPVKAVPFWLAAGRHFRTVYSKTGTIDSYKKAAELIKKNPFLFPVELIHQVFIEWGNYAYDMSDDRYCEQISEKCLELGELRLDPLLIGTGLSGLGQAAGMRLETEKAQEFFQRAIFYLRKAERNAELCETYARVGNVWFENDQYIKAREALEEGLRLADAIPDAPGILEVYIDILSQLCPILIYSGYTKRAHELALAMVNYSRGVNRRSALVQSYTILALSNYFNGNFLEAIKVCIEIRELAERLQLRFWLPLIDIILGRSYLMTGDLDKAWLHTHQALTRVDKHWSEKLYAQAWLVLGDIYRSTGENAKAAEAYRSVINTEIQSIQTIEGRYFLGVTLVNMGKIREALVWFNRAMDLSSHMGLTGLELRARITRLIISIGTKTLTQNKEDVDWLVKEVKERGAFYGEFFSRWAMAIAPEKQGDTQLAIEKYKDLVKYCEEINAPFLEIIPLQKILDVAHFTSVDRNQAKSQFAQRIRDLSHKATTSPVKGLMQRMRRRTRKNWQYFVNDPIV